VRLDFVRERVFRGVLDDRVARLEFQEPRAFTNTRIISPANVRASPVNQVTSLLGPCIRVLLTRQQDDIGIEGICDIVAHDLEAAFRLCFCEREAELVETTVGQLQLVKQRLANPATTVIRSQFVIRHDCDAALWDLHSHLARRDQNPEVRHSSLRPVGEARRERTFKASVHRVVLSAFGRSRSTNQPVVDAVDVEPRKSTFHSGAFHLIERLGP